MTAERRARIAALNDQLRRPPYIGGRIFVTRGIKELGLAAIDPIMDAVGAFDDFNDQNDPRDEHDFGAVAILGHQVFFKFHYYDRSLSKAAVDPADQQTCVRVMTIMLAEEY